MPYKAKPFEALGGIVHTVLALMGALAQLDAYLVARISTGLSDDTCAWLCRPLQPFAAF